MNAHEDLKVMIRYRDLLHRLRPLVQLLQEAAPVEYTGVVLTAGGPDAVARLRMRVAQVAGVDARLVAGAMDDGPTVAVVAAARTHSSAIKELFWREGLSEMHVAPQLESLSLEETLAALERRVESLQDDTNAIDNDLAQLSDRYGLFLGSARLRCLDRLAFFEALTKVATTRRSFCVVGWSPRDRLSELTEHLYETFRGAVIAHEVQTDDISPSDIPVRLSNLRVARPFEVFLRFLGSLPRYRTIDPTLLMALFFPLFFGMILGDVFYGVLVMAASVVLYRLARRGRAVALLRAVAAILATSGAAAVVFGFLYGELLGDVGREWGMQAIHPLLHREEAIIPSLFIAVGLGATHIVLGYALGLANALRYRHWHQFAERLCELLGLVSVVAVIAAIAGVVPRPLLTVGTLLLVAALVAMFALHNFLAPLEIVKTLGNILSYARIMAIGLSSAIIAGVANQLARSSGDVVVGILIAVSLHAVNLALGLFSPTIHAARLHFVEFFGKFYETGGRPFMPFKHARDDA